MTEPTAEQPGPEIATLLDCLTGQRRHVLGILDGLGEADLRRPVLPSGWSCLGLVRHLALDVERFWFGAVLAGDPAVIAALDEEPNAWLLDPEVPAAAILDLYRRETSLADAIITATPPDTAPAWWPTELFGEQNLHSHREILLHVITETACHTGHLDAVRELIDGRQRLVLTD
ncbi:DinB family protein [Streptomyces sp. NBC_00433]